MKTQEVIDHYGSIKAVADELGTWPQTVYQWGDEPPMARQYEIEIKTGGKLKASTEKA